MAFKLNHFCLVFVLAVWQQVSAMRIQIETQKYDGIIPESFKITCAPEGTNICSKKILAIQVSKNSDNPIVTLQQPSDILYDKLLAANVKAEGHIHKNIHKTQLTVTFTNVLTEDSGMYTCTMIYLDPSGILQQDSTSENYIVESQNAHSLVRYLMTEVSSVKTLLHHQQNNTDALELQLNQKSKERDDNDEVVHTHLLQRLADLETTLKKRLGNQQKEIDSLNTQLGDQQNETNSLKTLLEDKEKEIDSLKNHYKLLDNKVTQHVTKDSFRSAFLAGGSGSYELNKIVKYTIVKLNIGGHYNSGTGVYTAPVDGLYVFHLLGTNYNSDLDVRIEIRVNGVAASRMRAL